jgi:hypothetical protein
MSSRMGVRTELGRYSANVAGTSDIPLLMRTCLWTPALVGSIRVLVSASLVEGDPRLVRSVSP